MNINEFQKEQQIVPILRLGFRPFFLLGSLFALIAMGVWLLVLKGVITINPLNGPMWWHSHEMLFGFSSAIIAGFLLTAVQTWTNIASPKGTQLLALVSVWLLARFLILFASESLLIVTMVVDIVFLPLTAFVVGIRIIKIRQYRNLVFIPVLSLMAIMNLFTYLPNFGWDAQWSNKGMHGMSILITFLVAFLGGRVIPMFTASGTQTVKVLPLKWLELLCMLSLFLVFFVVVVGDPFMPFFASLLCFSAAIVHLFRQWRWRIWLTLRVPLVWSLHVSMLFIPVGLVLLGTHYLNGLISFSGALHSLTVGVIGGMILAMLSRVSLGHTGRMLKINPIMQCAFIAIVISALVRSLFVAIWPEFTMLFWTTAGVLWCAAFGLFLWVYVPILLSPRVDGKPG